MLTRCWMTLLNTLVGAIELLLFVFKTLQSGSSIHTFQIFLPMLGNLLGTCISPFSNSIHTMHSYFHLSWILVVLYCLFFSLIICLICSWLVTILLVSSSVTHFFLLILLFLELSLFHLSHLCHLSHCFSTLLLLDLVSIMVLVTCVIIHYHLFYSM